MFNIYYCLPQYVEILFYEYLFGIEILFSIIRLKVIQVHISFLLLFFDLPRILLFYASNINILFNLTKK